MKPKGRQLALVALGLIACVLVFLFLTMPRHAVAVLRVVDSSGKPIAGAVIKPEGMRTKPGPYRSGWYTWMPERNGVPNPPVSTDKEGYARVPYPKYVFEKIETGVLCLAVEHPEYVPDRPERPVAGAPPRGAPWNEWLKWMMYVGKALAHQISITRPDPIVLQRGAILLVSARTNETQPRPGRLTAQVSSLPIQSTNFWMQTAPGSILSRQLGLGTQSLRAVQLNPDGSIWFSDLVSISLAPGVTNRLELDMKAGVTVRGSLDSGVPRPVKSGRVIAHIWPQGSNPQSYPAQWHSWAKVGSDGTFEIPSLPGGDLELVALCEGFVSTNGPGQFHMRYPQKYVLGSNDISVVIGMERTARLEVTVTDHQGRPVRNATVMTWPNVRYGEWSATVLASDLQVTSDWLFGGPVPTLAWSKVPDFQGVTDSNGVAVLGNVPADVTTLSASHDRFELPPIKTGMGDQRREASVSLTAGVTNYLKLQLVPRGDYTISHY